MKLTKLFEYYEQILLEGKIELIAKKQGKKIKKALYKDKPRMNTLGHFHHAGGKWDGKSNIKDISDQDVIGVLTLFQSKIHKKYVQWLANRYANYEFKLEDWSQVRSELKEFDKVKSRLAIKDINQYKSLTSLYSALDEFKDKDVRSNTQKSKDERKALFDDGEAELFYKDSLITITVPKTANAACELGKGTRWCTSARTHNAFHQYSRQGDLYIVDTKKEKFQLHFESGQFMDEEDVELDFPELFEKYPTMYKSLKKAFGKDKVKQFLTPKQVLEEDGYKGLVDVLKKQELKFDGDNNLIITEHPNVEDLIDDYGDDSAKWVIKVLQGEEEAFGSDYVPTSSDFDYLLSAEQEKILNKYAAEKYPDEWEDDEDWYDVLESSGDETLDELRQLYWQASESGAQSEMSKLLESSLEDFHEEFELDPDGLEWDKKYNVILPKATLIDYVENPKKYDLHIPTIDALVEAHGDTFYFDISISLVHPRYGYTDMDDEYFKSEADALLKDIK